MIRQLFACVALLGLCLAVGCDRDETPAQPAPSSGTGQATPAADPAKPAVDPAQAAKDAAAAVTAAAAEAQSKLDQVFQYVKEKKFDLAETALKELEARKASLPTAIQDKLGAARTALDAAKKGQMPAIPGL